MNPSLRVDAAYRLSVSKWSLTELAAVIHRPPSIRRSNRSQPLRKNFRQRYDDLEAQRAGLISRLQQLSEASKQHPGYKHALKLLNEIYRRQKLAQRLDVLHSASWLISLLEDLQSS